jgi:hypothetical protein
MRRRMNRRNDSGAALILVLIVITVASLGVAALLSFSDTSIRTTVALRSEGTSAYDADGAANAAINTLRRNAFNNDTSNATYPKCFGNGATSDTLLLPSFYGTSGSASAAVKCSPDPTSGAAGGLVQITGANKPGNAILTLGTNAGEHGIDIKALNNTTPFAVHGSVVSDSNIVVTNGSLVSNTAVTAHTGCSGTIVSVPAAACSSPIVADPDYKFEPYYGTPANAVPPFRTVPAATSANCPGKVMTFLPGYYDDAAALSSLMSGSSSPCKDSVWWFTPGIYYFDFHNGGNQNPFLSGTDQWLIKNGQLLAGTPVNAAGAPLGAPSNPITVPGACQNPIKSQTATGVQFIFGGDSQFQISGSADAEICGTYRSPADGRPPIAVYGLKSGTVPVTPPVTNLAATAATSSDFAAPAAGTLTSGASAADSKYDTWTKNGTSTQDGVLTLSSGFTPTPLIPAGSIVTSAKLRIVYGTSPAVVSRSIVIRPTAGGPAITKIVSNAAQTAAVPQTIDLNDTTATGLAASIRTNGFTGASMTYTSTMTTAGVENIDAVLLDVSYIPPAFRAEDTTSVPGNCLASTYSGTGSGECAVISTTTAYSGSFYIQATTYVPVAVIDLTLNNPTQQVLRFGVISRSLFVKETGSITYTGPVIEVPDDSNGLGPGGTIVYLSVYVCPSATCSTSTGKLRLKSRVLIYDPSGTPSPPARQISIQSWSTLR